MTKKTRLIIGGIVLLAGVLGLYFFYTSTSTTLQVHSDSGLSLQVDVARSPAEHQQGLSGRQELKRDGGMLFISETPTLYGFHMPNMNFPLDIFWLNEDKQIFFIKENAHPDEYPEVYYPPVPAQYVLETSAGIAEEYELEIGDTLSW